MHGANLLVPRLFLGLVIAALAASVAAADHEAGVIALMRSGKARAAMALADQELAKNPRDPKIRFLKALMQHQAGRHALAIAGYNKLIADYPGLPEPYNNLAALYAGLGQVDKARDTWELASRASRSLATSHEKLGDVYADLATRTYRQALQLDESGGATVPSLPLIHQLVPGVGDGTAAAVSGVAASREPPISATPARSRSNPEGRLAPR